MSRVISTATVALEVTIEPEYEIAGELGRGGMATVYLATDPQTGQQVALKVLHAHLADRPSTRRRLDRELEAAKRVSHPAIVHPIRRIEYRGCPALVLPAFSGTTLQDRVRDDGPLSEDELQTLLEQIGGALAAAHGVGVLHRDVTPNNVLWDDQIPRLVDFGLARLADQGTASTGALGTVGYAAPESYLDGATDPRADAYSLGAVLYFAASGRPAFDAPTAMGALQQQLDGLHTPLADLRPDLPPALVQTIESLLSTEPEHRPSIPAALRMQTVLRAEPSKTTQVQWTQVGSLVSLLAMVAIGWFQDLGAFGLSTVIDGHAIPKPEIHQMAQGVSAMLLVPVSMLPAVFGALWGRDDPQRHLAPWVGVATLSLVNLLYAMLAGVILPEMRMTGTADLFGTMLFHQGLFVLLAAVVVAMSRPWRDLRTEITAPEAQPVPLADQARAALSDLLHCLDDAPVAVALDLRGLVRDLQTAVTDLEAELATVETALSHVQTDPAEQFALETQRARLLARDRDVTELDQALQASRRLQEQADALQSRRVRAVASLLEVRACAVHARQQVMDLDEAVTVTTDLTALRDRARLARAAQQEL